MPTTLSGPSRPPLAGGIPRQLVILLHGYGADGEDLIGLSPFFAQALPHAEFIAPNAPERCGMGFGYQWFGLTNLERETMVAGMAQSAPILDAFIEQAMASRHLSSHQLALVGFSQGTMMALDWAMRRGDAAAIVGFSGMVADPTPRLPETAKRPSILLIHGTADPIVPYAHLQESETALRDAEFSVETMTCPGVGHGIDPEGAQRAASFLAGHLSAKALI